MHKIKSFLFFIVIFWLGLLNNALHSQTNFDATEQKLVAMLQNMRSAANDSIKDAINDQFRNELIQTINQAGSFDHPFSGLSQYMSNLIAPDNKLRIYNWNISYSDYSNTYFALVQTYDKKSKNSSYYELIDFTNSLDKLENKYLKPEKWLGALYYEIIPIKKGKKTIYTLLGWSILDKTIQQKTIDAISINAGKLRLGAPIFKSDTGTKKRIIIKYSMEVKVSLKWREKENRIVFDHVVPRDPAMQGAYAFYGPDLSFDSYNLVKGKWIFEKDVDVRMGKNDNRYNDPRPRNERRNNR